MKTCRKCGKAKPLDLFSRKKAGYQAKCKACCSEEHKAWHAANREAANAKSKARYQNNREQSLEKQKTYYAEHKNVRLAYAKQWREENPGKVRAEYVRNGDAYRSRVKAWRANNPDARRAQEVARRARVRWVPPWADREAMAAVYREARGMRALGVDVHVDHIIPLRGKTVSGLHTHNNLRLVLAEDNLKKNAKFIEELL